MFQEMEPTSSKIMKFLIFPEMELSSLIFLYFRRELSQLVKNTRSEKISYILGNETFYNNSQNI